MAEESVVRDLLDKVQDDSQSDIEHGLKTGGLTRQTICHEIFIPSLLDTTLTDNPLALKLLQCEINSLSPFHLAAMLGKFDILMTFLGAGIEADTVLESGTTALHLASFGGHKGTVELLCTVFQADVNKQDRYY